MNVNKDVQAVLKDPENVLVVLKVGIKLQENVL